MVHASQSNFARSIQTAVYAARHNPKCFNFHYAMLASIIDVTVRDRKLKFPLNQNVLCDVTSRWSTSSMRIIARNSD